MAIPIGFPAMRMIGSLPDETTARVFGDYLVARGMDAHIEESNSGGWQVWVEHDDHLDQAKAELEQYRANPADGRYQAAVKVAEEVRQQREKSAERRRRNFTDVRTSWAQAAGRPTPVTIALIVLCIVVFIAMASNDGAMLWLLIVPVEFVGDGVRVGSLQQTLQTFQWWRFVSPILVHGDFFHILFNMMWLLNFGGQIERSKGSLMLVALVLITAIPSNLAQAMTGNPFFGGMSGVVYALFGYIWMKSRLQPHEQMAVDQTTVYILIGWMVLCMTLLDNIGNAAHVVGLMCGLGLGAAPYYLKRLRRSRS